MIKRILLFLSLSITIYSQETVVITEDIEEENSTLQISEIYEDEIEALKAATTGELVSNIPGIKLSKAGTDSQGSWVSIRGSSPEQVLVLLNGRRLNSSQGGGVNFNTIPVESIKKIEIIRGGGSAFYGGSAFGGIINIITTDRDLQFFKTGYSLNSLLSSSGYGNLSKKITDKLFLETTLSGKYDNGIFRDNSELKSFNGDLFINFNPWENRRISLNSNIYIDHKGVPGSVEFPSTQATLEDSVFNIGTKYSGSIISGDISYMSRDRIYNDPEYPLGKIQGEHSYKTIRGEISEDLSLLKTTVTYNYDYLESSSYSSPQVDRSLLSLRVAPTFKWSVFSLSPTGRVDFLDFKEFLPSWNIGVSTDINSGVKLKSNIGSAYRLPGFDDLFWPDSSFAQGNPDLEPEKGILFDLGGNIQLTDSLTLNLVGYYNWIEDLIVWNPGPGGVWSPGNLGYSEIYGVESELSYILMSDPLNGFIEGRVNYTYLSALNKTDGVLYNKRLINRAEHKSNLLVIYRNFNNWLVTLDLSYIGDRYLTGVNSKLAEGYLLLDVSSTIPLPKDLSLTLYCKNLLDIEYEDYRGHPVPGIVFGAGISYRRDFYE